MKKNNMLAATLVVAGLLSPLSAMAGALTTTVQTQSFEFLNLDDATTLAFNGFDSSLGTLHSFHFEWSMDKTLNNVVFKTTAGSVTIGNPTPISATSTTTFTGSTSTSGALFTSINTLTTDGFTGLVGQGMTTVGTKSAPGLSGVVDFCNDGSCLPNVVTNLSPYIGGINFLDLAINNAGSQGGSVPSGVFTGNTGTARGTVSLFYDYDLIPNTGNVPEPTILGLVGLGLAGFTASRKKEQV